MRKAVPSPKELRCRMLFFSVFKGFRYDDGLEKNEKTVVMGGVPAFPCERLVKSREGRYCFFVRCVFFSRGQ